MSPAETKVGKSLVFCCHLSHRSACFGRAEGVQHLVARAHRVVVGLAGRALFVAVLAVVAGQDAVPRAVFVIDEMRPAIAPELVVAVPEALAARARAEQRGGGEAFGLHPEVFVVVADGVVGAEAVVQAAVAAVPGAVEAGVEEFDGARREPRQRAMAFENQQQLGPFGLMAGLEAPRTEDVRAVGFVVMPVDRPVRAEVLPDQSVRQLRLPQRDVARDLLRAIQIDDVAGRLERGEQRLGRVHVGVLAAIVGKLPVGRGFVGVKAGVGVPEAALHQMERLVDQRRALRRCPPSTHARTRAARTRGRSSGACRRACVSRRRATRFPSRSLRARRPSGRRAGTRTRGGRRPGTRRRRNGGRPSRN